jgi:hypothetical protein
MSFKFNPIGAMGFDIVGSSSGGSGPAERSSTTHNNVLSWGSPSGGEYTITITAGTHGKGTSPNVQTYELVSGNYVNVFPSIVINNTGDVSIKVLETPDLRFTGKILII